MNTLTYNTGKRELRRAIKRVKRWKLKLKAYSVFRSWKDRITFYHLSHGRIIKEKVLVFNIKTAGKSPVICRNNNTDHCVISSTFFDLYHLPPAPLKSNAVIVDLGANIGLTIRHYKYLYPDSTVIGVELDRENYLLARKNLRGIDNCILLNGAIWYRDGYVNYQGADAQSFHCVDSDISEAGEGVKSYSLMTLFHEFDLSHIDFMKMDIEGAESKIFEDDCSWLSYVDSVNLEVHNGEPLTKYMSVLERHGFKCEASTKHWASILAYK